MAHYAPWRHAVACLTPEFSCGDHPAKRTPARRRYNCPATPPDEWSPRLLQRLVSARDRASARAEAPRVMAHDLTPGACGPAHLGQRLGPAWSADGARRHPPAPGSWRRRALAPPEPTLSG